MTNKQKKELLNIINSIDYGQVIIHIQANKINHVKKVKSIKLNNN